MRTYPCRCGNSLFFQSQSCVACGKPAAMCPHCLQVSTRLDESQGGSFRCGNPACGKMLRLCQNDEQYQFCNRGIDAEEKDEAFCSYCRLNEIVPDLSDTDNLDKWFRIELAKRRVLCQLERLGFPIDAASLPLRFRFLADDNEPVSTGHADGCITLNVKEADSVHREQARVNFAEPHRTLVGHFRHELGHYYWQLLVSENETLLKACRKQFGDETKLDYDQARQQYYDSPPPPNWQSDYVSAYATMHPWEDFAETFNTYLDMVAVVDTSLHFGLTKATWNDFDKMLSEYRRLGVIANELNRDMGLIDLVPEVFTPVITDKLRFVNKLRKQ